MADCTYRQRACCDDLTGVEGPNHTRYDLVSNITHTGKPDDGRYSVHLRHKPTDSWYEVEDLYVEERSGSVVALSEAFLQVCIHGMF